MAETWELVGVGPQQLGEVEGWCVTYQKFEADEEGGIPGFHHHMFPATIFTTFAEQFGLNVDDDFDEILDIVLHESLAGDDDPTDDVDGPRDALKGASDRKTKTGRRMARRAARGKKNVTVTGVEHVRDRLRADRHKGANDLRSRIERLERHRARRLEQAAASGHRSHEGDRAAQAPDR